MNYKQNKLSICNSEKNYKRYAYLFGISFIIGLILTLYGSSTLPTDIPGHNQIYISNSNSNEESQQYQTDLRNYQIQSKEFKIIMVGVGIIIISFVFGCISHIKYNIHFELEETRQNKKPILKVKRNNDPKILPLEIADSNTVIEVTRLNTSKNKSPDSPLIMLKATPNNRTIPRSYYECMPPSYQEYFKKNGYPVSLLKK